jgi:hypothetical protein
MNQALIAAFNNNEVIFTRQGCNKHFDSFDRPVLVVISLDKEFRFFAPAQKRKVRVIDRHTQANQVRHSRIFAARL